MNSHAHERLGKSFIVAFEGDSCPYCELLKEYIELTTQTTGSQAEAINEMLDDLAKTPEEIEKELFGGLPIEPEVGQIWVTRPSAIQRKPRQIIVVEHDCPIVKYRSDRGTEGSVHWDRLLHFYACVRRPDPTKVG